ncbi:MAG: DUF47 family protein [Spirochaetota bacterium]
MHKKENEADILRREIDREMFQGAFMQSLRETLFMTVDSVDKVTNRSEKLGDFLTPVSTEFYYLFNHLEDTIPFSLSRKGYPLSINHS